MLCLLDATREERVTIDSSFLFSFACCTGGKKVNECKAHVPHSHAIFSCKSAARSSR